MIESDNDWFEKCEQESKERLDSAHKRAEEKRRNYKGPYCCLTMDRGLSSDRNILEYDKQYREYGVYASDEKGGFLFSHCMFCGKELPHRLRNKWFDILQEEYGLESPLEEDKKKVPKEFKTDEWWKKRGL